MRSFVVPQYDPGLSTLMQRFGPFDPTCLWRRDRLVKAFWTPEGPCTLGLAWLPPQIEAEAQGPGARWCYEHLPEMFQFAPQDSASLEGRLARLARQWRGLKVAPVLWRFDMAVAFVLQQRVTFGEAARSYAQLVRRWGQAAPGPLDLRLSLSPRQWLELGADRIQAAGVDAKRARTLLRVARLGLEFDIEGLARLQGVGPWTLESVKGWGWGDPDAVPLGDVHLPHEVCAFFSGHPAGDDQRMLEWLEPYRGMRLRVIQWIMLAGRMRGFAGL